MEHNVRIPTSDGVQLVAQVWWPLSPTTAEARAAASVGVVVSHPYGPLGGNMHNNVVETVYDAMRHLGHAVVRFNFRYGHSPQREASNNAHTLCHSAHVHRSRGIGGSTGRGSWRGTGEMEDVRSVCAYLLSPPPEGTSKPAVSVTRIVLVVGWHRLLPSVTTQTACRSETIRCPCCGVVVPRRRATRLARQSRPA